ncbi:major capsid protein [Streptomyces harbinensis]|uniref:major capsid protein n=1 Tax=Streptomyces harbinensis TaxID=1176198 RepID=UPI003716958B
MNFLESLLARLADLPADQHADAIREALTSADGLDTGALSADVVARFGAAQEAGITSDEEVAAVQVLAAVADGIQAHEQAREARQEQLASVTSRINTLVPPTPEPVTEPTGSDPAPAPAEPVAAEPAPAPQAVAASAVRPSPAPIPLGRVPSTPPPADDTEMGRDTYSLVAAADVSVGTSTYQAGLKLDGLVDLGKIWGERMRAVLGSKGRERRQVPIARIQRHSPAELTINDATDHVRGQEVMRLATDETRLKGGSLTAAGGWCAPSETLYDLCPIRISDQGMVSLPTITAPRGGIRYPADFDWASLWGSIGFHQTEAEAIDGVEKPCFEIPCPDDLIECRLDPTGVCLRTPILSERGWPERIAQFTEGALAIHAHQMNAWKLGRMEALSTAVTMPAPGAPDPQAAVVDPHGPGAVESMLSQLELLVQHYRYRERLSQTESLEMIAPYWLRGILKSDLRKKLGVDNRWSISDSQLDTYLRSVGVSPQWVYDWQDAYSDGDEAGFGGVIPTVWPSEVKIMLYRAGAFFQLQSDVISLDGVYDAASLAQNMYTSLFTEEGIQVCKRCGDSYVITIPLCPSGLSGGVQSVTCVTSPEPEALAPAA